MRSAPPSGAAPVSAARPSGAAPVSASGALRSGRSVPGRVGPRRAGRRAIVVGLAVAVSLPAQAVAVVGGRAAPPGSLPASARWDGRCSGALVARRDVLIALHCVATPPQSPTDAIGTHVLLGDPNGGGAIQRRVVIAARLAPQAAAIATHSPDLAVLELDRPALAVPLALPTSVGQASALTRPNQPLLFAGFGLASASSAGTLSPVLGEATVTSADCAAAAPDIPPAAARYELCAVPAGSPGPDGSPGGSACVGDSGAAGLAAAGGRLMVVGVVSGSDAPAACASGSPVLFAPVADVLGWLRSELARRLPRPVPPDAPCRRARRALVRARRQLRSVERPGGLPAGARARRIAQARARVARASTAAVARC